MYLFAALSLGFIGSLHCIGMCGPLVLALPSNGTTRWRFIRERIVYHSGRAALYGLMGAIVGLFGETISLAGFQQPASIIFGVLIILSLILPLGLKTTLRHYSPLTRLYAFVKVWITTFLKKRGAIALFILGMLNGLLPCGLVYTALIGATAIAHAGESALFMILFGVGTMPALVVVSMAGRLLSVRFRPLVKRAIPLFTLMVGAILILRGMNLGIPLVSPKMHTVSTQQQPSPQKPDCCE